MPYLVEKDFVKRDLNDEGLYDDFWLTACKREGKSPSGVYVVLRNDFDGLRLEGFRTIFNAICFSKVFLEESLDKKALL